MNRFNLNKTKKGAAALVIAAILTLVMLFTACPNSAGGGGGGGSGSGGGGTPTPPEAPFVAGSAVLILTPGTNSINVRAKTSDDSIIKVLGCIEPFFASDASFTLHVKKDLTKVILTGKIIELDYINNKLTALNVQGLTDLQQLNCINNELTALNVQGLTALQVLDCSRNQLTALNVQGCSALKTLHCEKNKLNGEAFTKIFTDLPARGASDDATCYVYSERKLQTGQTEGNCKDFTTPETLKNAFYAAKGKNWKMQKEPMLGDWEELDVPSVPGSAELTLTAGTTEIKVKAVTSDGSAMVVEGCNEITLASGGTQATTLHVKSGVAKVVLKGNITELNCMSNQLTALNLQGLTDLQTLDCSFNQLTALNVQGCFSLKTLYCQMNKLNADAFTKIFTDLPPRNASDGATCRVYTNATYPGQPAEGNCTNFSTPESLKAAFDGAKDRKWKLQKQVASGWVDI